MVNLLASIIDQLGEMNAANKKFNYEKMFKPGGSNIPTRELRVDYIDAVFFATKKGRKPLGTMNVIDAMVHINDDVYLFAEFDLRDAVRVELR